MAYQPDIILAVKITDIENITEVFPEWNPTGREYNGDVVYGYYQEELNAAFAATLDNIKFSTKYILKSAFPPWTLQLYNGKENWDDGVDRIGIPLSSRYHPAYLDYRNPSGGIHGLELDSPEVVRMLNEAKVQVGTRVPILNQDVSHIYLIEKEY